MRRLWVLTIIGILCFSMFSFFRFGLIRTEGSALPITAHAADALWVEDSASGATSYAWNTTDTQVGYTFTDQFCLNLSTAESLFSWQVEFTFPSFITFVGTTATGEGPWMDGYTDTGTTWTLETATMGEAFDELAPNATYSSIPGHAGVLFNVTFEVNAAPTMLTSPFTGAINVTFQNVPGGDTWYSPDNSTFIPYPQAYDLPITYTWTPPTTHPYMTVVLSTPPRTTGTGTNSSPLVYGPIPPSAIGQTFTATVSVTNVDPAWTMDDADFTMTWNSTVIDVLGAPGANLTLASDWSVTTNTVAAGGLGKEWTFAADSTGGASGTVPVATLTFTVVFQSYSYFKPLYWVDFSYVVFLNQVFSDPAGTLTADLTTVDSSRSGYVTVSPIFSPFPPHLEMVPSSTIVGPSPSKGMVIFVSVNVVDLTHIWEIIAIQFRLQYDDSVLSFVSASEGPFLTNPTWDPYGTAFSVVNEVGGDGTYPFTHLKVSDQLNPNPLTGSYYDVYAFPNTDESSGVNSTLATFAFQVLQQNSVGGATINASLNILPFSPTTILSPGNNFISATSEGNFIPSFPDVNGTVTIEAVGPFHDVAVTNVTSSKIVVFQGYNLNMSVTAADPGNYTETFNVTAYANTTYIASQNVTLNGGDSTTLTFTWNTAGFAKGNYTISAYAWPVQAETNTANNNFIDGFVYVSMAGDLTGATPFVPDGKCDGRDITVVAKCFGSRLGDPRYNPNCDILDRGKIDGRDITIVAKHFGQHDP